MTAPDPMDIVRLVAARSGRTAKQILGAQRHPSYAGPRMLSMYLVRTLLGLSLPEIGRVFHRHHTTVHHAIVTVEAEMRADAACAGVVADLAFEVASQGVSGEVDLDAAWRRYRTQRPCTAAPKGWFDEHLWMKCVALASGPTTWAGRESREQGGSE